MRRPKIVYNHPDIDATLALARLNGSHKLHGLDNLVQLWFNPLRFLRDGKLRFCSDQREPVAGLASKELNSNLFEFILGLRSYAKVLQSHYFSDSRLQSLRDLCFTEESLLHLRGSTQFASAIVVLRAKDFLSSDDFINLLLEVPNNSLFTSYNYIQSVMISYNQLRHDEVLLLIDKLRPHYKRLLNACV